MFPNARDVVRPDDPRWGQLHMDLLRELTHQVGCIVHGSKSLAEMEARLDANVPRVPVDDCFAHVLFAPKPFRIEAGKVSLDAKGLVFEPRIRSSNGIIVVDL